MQHNETHLPPGYSVRVRKYRKWTVAEVLDTLNQPVQLAVAALNPKYKEKDPAALGVTVAKGRVIKEFLDRYNAMPKGSVTATVLPFTDFQREEINYELGL